MALLEGYGRALRPNNPASIGDVGISNQVVTRHVDYLRNAFLLWACPLAPRFDRTD
jgi:hypothetical protein